MDFSLATTSLWLWILAGCALWGFVGLVAASSQRMSLLLGLTAGAIGWFFGVGAILIVGIARRSATRFAAPASGNRAGYAPAGWEATSFGAVDHDQARPWASPASATGPLTRTGRGRDDQLWRHTLAGVGLLAGLAMLLSVGFSWGSWRVAWSAKHVHVNGGVVPLDVPVVGTLMILMCLVVLTAVALMWWRPRGTWSVLAVLMAAWWFTAIGQALIVGDVIHNAAARTTTSTEHQVGAGLTSAIGIWLMFTGCIGVFIWATASVARLVRFRAGGVGLDPGSAAAPTMMPTAMTTPTTAYLSPPGSFPPGLSGSTSPTPPPPAGESDPWRDAMDSGWPSHG